MKNRKVISRNTGTRMPTDQAIYPKKLGIYTPCSTAMERTMKL